MRTTARGAYSTGSFQRVARRTKRPSPGFLQKMTRSLIVAPPVTFTLEGSTHRLQRIADMPSKPKFILTYLTAADRRGQAPPALRRRSAPECAPAAHRGYG